MINTANRFDRAAHRGWVVDVSRTARSPFAPSEQLLRDYKAKRVDWAGYEVRYRNEMRRLYKKDPGLFQTFALLAAHKDITLTLTCWERGDERTIHCHRRLLADMLAKVARSCGAEIVTAAAIPHQTGESAHPFVRE